jgi:hypothetical protein
MKNFNMSRNLFYMMILFLPFSACNDDEEKSTCVDNNPDYNPIACPDSGECNTSIIESSTIVVNDLQDVNIGRIVDGEKTVFKFKFNTPEDILIPDANYVEAILFEIDSGTGDFFIKEDQLSNHNVLFGKLCLCTGQGYHRVESGCVKGEKLDENTWKVDINISLTIDGEEYKRMRTGVFAPL